FQAAAGRQTTSGHDFSLFLYVRTSERPWNIRSRMFAPLDNVPEDPATGSASAALGAYLVSLAAAAHFDALFDRDAEFISASGARE
ncbi:PhzF family phenazine biosynthesis protein, partial [Rhizobium johnstonii]|uniref:PhzF family phenazine biosynthesis protein n=1 Tax=Rhizobium johnstonii TaxID=3019933 RepID=UPI003F9C8686